MEQLEKQDKTVRKLKKQLKVFAKKINDLEGASRVQRQRVLKLSFTFKDSKRKSVFVTGGQMDVSPGQTTDEPVHPVNIPRREKDFQGMLEYKKEDELKLVKNLILGNTQNITQMFKKTLQQSFVSEKNK